MAKVKRPSKVRKNFLLPEDLAKWIETYAKENNTTMTQILVDHITLLRRQTEDTNVEQV